MALLPTADLAFDSNVDSVELTGIYLVALLILSFEIAWVFPSLESAVQVVFYL